MIGEEGRYEWLKLSGQGGGKIEQEVRTLLQELHGNLRGELEKKVWDMWPELCGQGWERLCWEPAYCILIAYCILHIECSTFTA